MTRRGGGPRGRERGQHGASALAVALATLILAIATTAAAAASQPPTSQLPPQATLAPSGQIGHASPGSAAALSSDGNTAVVGGPGDSEGKGAAWVFIRRGFKWTEQAKLTGGGEVGSGAFGASVALSGDGKTALIGGPSDNGGLGAAWVLTRSGSSWTQRGAKLLGTDAGGNAQEAHCERDPEGHELCFTGHPAGFGASVAVSSDGDTALVGAPGDNEGNGAAWVFKRTGQAWTQQGAKLIGAGATNFGAVHECPHLGSPCYEHVGARFGAGVALSASGSTALIGGPEDDVSMCEEGCGNGAGSAWVFLRSDSIWSQQGDKISPRGGEFPYGNRFGESVALSGSGATALLGGPKFGGLLGAASIFARAGTTWVKQAEPEGTQTEAELGFSVALSLDGDSALIAERPYAQAAGARVLVRAGSVWSQRPERLACGGEGCAVALSGDGDTALVGTTVFSRRPPHR
jgi:FG-GAP repeat